MSPTPIAPLDYKSPTPSPILPPARRSRFSLTVLAIILFHLAPLALILYLLCPAFDRTYQSIGGDLPAPTAVLMTASNVAHRRWVIPLLAVLPVALALFLSPRLTAPASYRAWKRTPFFLLVTLLNGLLVAAAVISLFLPILHQIQSGAGT